ncbi:hypothetical protein Sjap_012996 [Stephania japonica]|uniref:GIR1-like zinc ribbon domain-containing protein n=1 Tax=Stephania japonica TaxID=461633 RepID=A0AAP0IX41_9MAGN
MDRSKEGEGRGAPPGQAIITTSCAIIKSIQSRGWWDSICSAGGYDVAPIFAVAERILSKPWKYHIDSRAYGCDPLTAEEIKEVEDAKRVAIGCSILQAYIEVALKGSHARGGICYPLYSTAKVFFREAAKRKLKTITPVQANGLFAPPSTAELEENQCRQNYGEFDLNMPQAPTALAGKAEESNGSPQSSCTTSTTTNTKEELSEVASYQKLGLYGCRHCLMYVMVPEEDPRCLRCNWNDLIDVKNITDKIIKKK